MTTTTKAQHTPPPSTCSFVHKICQNLSCQKRSKKATTVFASFYSFDFSLLVSLFIGQLHATSNFSREISGRPEKAFDEKSCISTMELPTLHTDSALEEAKENHPLTWREKLHPQLHMRRCMPVWLNRLLNQLSTPQAQRILHLVVFCSMMAFFIGVLLYLIVQDVNRYTSPCSEYVCSLFPICFSCSRA